MIQQIHIKELRRIAHLTRKFRITGEPEEQAPPAWHRLRQKRQEREPWCEVTISAEYYTNGQPTGRLLVSTYGGELWPSAWPSLFIDVRRGEIELTPKARELFGF